MLQKFMDRVNSAKEKYISKSKPFPRKGTVPMCRNTVGAIKRKHRAWIRYIESRNENSYKLYVKARNKVKWMVKKQKREKEKGIAQSSKSNPKKFWKYVKSKRKTTSGVAELHTKKDNSTFIAETDSDKAEVLSDLFSSIFTKENCDSMPKLSQQDFVSESSDENFDKVIFRKLLNNHTGPSFNTGTENTIQVSKFKRIGFEKTGDGGFWWRRIRKCIFNY